MNTVYILVALTLIVNGIVCGVCAYFMHRNTLSIAAYKRSSKPWEAISLLGIDEKSDVGNKSTQPDDSEFGTIPNDIDPDALRSQL